MRISVIIPVYNAAKYVTRAVESTLEQPETAEVLLIEDGSPDNALEVCQQLAEKNERVILLRHPNGGNRGAGASRNLGMKNASCEYIAFLDADDFYLSGRFTTTKQVFEENATCEGVYEAAGVHIENKAGLNKWNLSGRSQNHFYTMRDNLPPEELTEALLNSGKYGYFHLDGLTLQTRVLQKSGLMNEQLRLHQDTEFIIRVSCMARLLPGNLEEAVAMVRVHDQNRITSPRSQAQEYKNRMAFWLSLYHWSKEYSNSSTQKLIIEAIIRYTKAHKFFKTFPREYFPARLVRLARLIRLLFFPDLIKDLIKKGD